MIPVPSPWLSRTRAQYLPSITLAPDVSGALRFHPEVAVFSCSLCLAKNYLTRFLPTVKREI